MIPDSNNGHDATSEDPTLSKILFALLKHSLRICSARYGGVGLFDHEGRCIYTHHTFGAHVPHLEPGTGITACVLSTRESVIIQDVRKPETFPASVLDCHYRPERSDTRSEIIVPLRLDQDCILGVIIVQSPHENWFDHSLVKIIESLANNAALVIRNTRHRTTLAELSTVGSKLAVGGGN